MKLREFGASKEFNPSKINEFRAFLNESWNNRYFLYDDTYIYKEEVHKGQQFLDFDGNYIKGRNYVGFISYQGENITIYPKAFLHEMDDEYIDKYLMMNITYWLKRCKKIKLPIIDNSINFDNMDSFLEVLIYIFGKYTYNLIYTKPYNCYEEVEEESTFLKGRLNVNKYLKENISNGRWNKFNTIHEPFVYNNKFNQIIKFVSNRLLKSAKDKESMEYLNKIIFILDEVDDVYCTAYDCNDVKLNRMQEDYKLVLSLCEMFLRNTSLSKSEEEGNLNFCFLVPMEMIFEDFIYEFIKEKFSLQYKEITAQKSNLYLANLHAGQNPPTKAFNLKQDIYLKDKNGNVIILDTKYKILDKSQTVKYGISQSDMYQMCSYALRGGYKNLALVYPMAKDFHEEIRYSIESEFIKEEIVIRIILVTFVLDYNGYMNNQNYNELCYNNDKKLYEEINKVLFYSSQKDHI